MDNASKALIIAGAILIAVMLVSLGVMLYNTAAGVAETTTGSVEALGVAGFNAQYEQYLGASKSKSQATGLVAKVLSNNANNDIYIGILYSGDTTFTNTNNTNSGMTENADLSALRNHINSVRNKRYDIEIDGTSGYNKDGTIKSIIIEQVDL